MQPAAPGGLLPSACSRRRAAARCVGRRLRQQLRRAVVEAQPAPGAAPSADSYQEALQFRRKGPRGPLLSADYDVFRYGQRPYTDISFPQLLKYDIRDPEQAPGHLIAFSRLMWHEIPVRLARRVRAIDGLPYGLPYMPPMCTLRDLYHASFFDMRGLPEPTTPEKCFDMMPVLSEILKRHHSVLELITQAIYELKKEARTAAELLAGTPQRQELAEAGESWWIGGFPQLQGFLDSFNRRRIGIRFLCGHMHEFARQTQLLHGGSGSVGSYRLVASQYDHVSPQNATRAAIASDPCHDVSKHIGMLCYSLDCPAITAAAVQHVEEQARVHYGECPEIAVEHVAADDAPAVVQSSFHVHYMLCELLKNSIRAVVEAGGALCSPVVRRLSGRYRERAPILVRSCVSGRQNVTFCVLDEGTGIRRSMLGRAMSYLYTTAEPVFVPGEEGALTCSPGEMEHRTDEVGSAYARSASPFAGYGYGLPITKCLAEFLGGQFEMASMQNVGTAAYIYLPTLDKVESSFP